LCGSTGTNRTRKNYNTNHAALHHSHTDNLVNQIFRHQLTGADQKLTTIPITDAGGRGDYVPAGEISK
jgi:hypothetical protein